MMYLRMVARRTCKLLLKMRHVDFDVFLVTFLILAACVVLYTYTLSSRQQADTAPNTLEWNWEDFDVRRDFEEFVPPKSPEEIEIIFKRAQLVNLSRLISSLKMGKGTSGLLCEHPHLDLQHDANSDTFYKMEPFTCNGSNLFHLSNHNLLLRNNVLNGKKLKKCTYHGVMRLNDDYVMDTELHQRNKAPFQIRVLHDFVHIYCYYESNVKTTKTPEVVEIKKELEQEYYDNRFHEFSDLEAELHADVDEYLVQVYPSIDVLRRIKATKTSKTATKLNVLMFALDSMSHLSYQRNLPQTYAYLRDVLGSVVLNNYNIVGDATTAAILPIFTGKMEWELPEARRNMIDSVYVDEYPLVWSDYNKSGYVTMYAEDEPSLGTFNLRLNGFDSQPTDHYMRPFWKRIWDSMLNEKSHQYCLGGVPKHRYLIDYTKDFYMKYAGVPKFSFTFSSQLSHSDNNPAQYIDADLTGMLEFLRTNGRLDNTVVIIFGDHGSRTNKVRWTVQGKLEERLPFMSISVPQQFKKDYPQAYKNLVTNSARLTTPFDIHETLLDLLNVSRLEQRDKLRGVSVFQEISPNRTCSEAGIEIHWCTCMKHFPADISSPHVVNSVNVAVKYINSLVTGPELSSLCAPIGLTRIKQAYIVVPNEQVLRFEVSSDSDNRFANFSSSSQVDVIYYQITVETSPNDALYEFTVQVNVISSKYEINGEISRINTYGHQADCVLSRYTHLRKYCFCKPKPS